jgi:hypothetical protein
VVRVPGRPLCKLEQESQPLRAAEQLLLQVVVDRAAAVVPVRAAVAALAVVDKAEAAVVAVVVAEARMRLLLNPHPDGPTVRSG